MLHRAFLPIPESQEMSSLTMASEHEKGTPTVKSGQVCVMLFVQGCSARVAPGWGYTIFYPVVPGRELQFHRHETNTADRRRHRTHRPSHGLSEIGGVRSRSSS